ncbi:MAG: serine hydrolase [Spirochaetes bacterium]|jgi:CubicO group peptidase (beta-lactamase class C family)|nr:serine hydrolase [Spirochaetota bacterium]
MAEKRSSRRGVKIVGIVLGVLMVAGLLGSGRIIRLYRVITLFDSDKIVENFRSMGEMLDSRVVRRGPEVYEFKRANAALPDTYIFRGSVKKVGPFLERTGTTGIVVVRDDTILHERYCLGNTETSKAISWSVAKSFVSALFGIAMHEGHIKDIMEPVTGYVPLLKVSGYNDVPIKHVLQMSSGVRFNEDYADFNSDINRMGRAIALKTPLDDFVASLQSERKPGVYNHYVSMDTQVLGMIIREATGKTLSAYTEEKLWKPLGMESDALWLVDSAGMEAAFGGLNVVLRDYARFGRLYLNNGNWNGVQVVPAAWVKASVTPDAPHLMPGKRDSSGWVLGYGYQWWIPENPEGDFLAIGIYGQFIYIHPRHRIVIAKTSAYADYNRDGDDMEIESIEMFRAIARAMGK